jgi:hypothetical protein
VPSDPGADRRARRRRGAHRQGRDLGLSKIDEHEARETIAILERMGEAYEQEVRELKASAEP